MEQRVLPGLAGKNKKKRDKISNNNGGKNEIYQPLAPQRNRRREYQTRERRPTSREKSEIQVKEEEGK